MKIGLFNRTNTIVELTEDMTKITNKSIDYIIGQISKILVVKEIPNKLNTENKVMELLQQFTKDVV